MCTILCNINDDIALGPRILRPSSDLGLKTTSVSFLSYKEGTEPDVWEVSHGLWCEAAWDELTHFPTQSLRF
jgi:hypothetical protein